MCGIFGIYNLNSLRSFDHSLFKDSLLKMEHRGPDANSVKYFESKALFGHVRLSIIDLSEESNQPFQIDDRYWIVFNGEIYNYIELRNELVVEGCQFRTESDTEVLLKAYQHWGENCVTRFNGDWSFSIYDAQLNSLFCSRDRFGVKPFNYSIVDGQFIFSSEIKSILNYFPQLKSPNFNVISNYCRNSLGAQISKTWFNNIYRLLPGHNLVIKNGNLSIERYWDYPHETIKNISFTESVDKYNELFINAVRLRMRSDVPVGTTLSSGIDSSSIVSVLRRFYDGEHKVFTASFDTGDYQKRDKEVYSQDINIDEATIVKNLAKSLKLNSHIINTESGEFVNDLYNAIYYLESGNSSPATIPLTQIMSYARSYVTVILEGQGADELLGGYIVNNFPLIIIGYLKQGKFKELKREFSIFRKYYSLAYSFKQFIRNRNWVIVERIFSFYSGRNNIFGPKLKVYKRIKDYPFKPSGFDDSLNTELYKSHTGGLVNLLHYGDAISMSKSIESRLPFMDVNLVEFSFQLPFRFKVKNGLGKYIHRVAMKNIVPDSILTNPIKLGFNTPLSQHFESYESPAIQILLSDKCIDRQIFRRSGLVKTIEDHISGKGNQATMLFRLLSVELWFRQFIDNSDK